MSLILGRYRFLSFQEYIIFSILDIVLNCLLLRCINFNISLQYVLLFRVLLEQCFVV